MKVKLGTCPQSASSILQSGFVESRSRLLDLASFLDRIDRSQNPSLAQDDPRFRMLRAAVQVLQDGGADRVRRMQLIFSSEEGSQP